MQQPKTIDAILNASVSKATAWELTASGLAIDTQTITIGGVVFTTVAALSVGPAVAGEVLLGANQAATLTNLTAAINAPSVTTTTFTKLSSTDANKLKNILGLSATTTATVMTLKSSTKQAIVVSETETNLAWTVYYTSDPIAFGEVYGKLSAQFIASGITGGNGVFSLEVSNDQENWVTYNRMITNVVGDNTKTDAKVASITLSANSNAFAFTPVGDVYTYIRAKVIPTTDGLYSAKLFVA